MPPAQGGLAGAGLVVRMGGGHVAQRGLGLRLDELLVGLDSEDGAGGVGHLPHDDGGDIDGVALQVVDLELTGLEVVDLDGDLLAGGQRQDEHHAGAAHGADVLAEELADAGLPGDDDHEGADQQHDHERDPHEPADDSGHRPRLARVGGVDIGDGQNDQARHDRQQEDEGEEGSRGSGGARGPLRDVDATGDPVRRARRTLQGRVGRSSRGGGTGGHENLLG